MQKLTRIAIKNFQSIEDATLELGDITIITGKSRSGKSAFFRAVKGAVENMSGDSFVTFGKKESVVTLDNVSWIQSKTKNEYAIAVQSQPDGDIDFERFEKCGRETPEAVRNELGMGRIEFGDGLKANLNFCDQLGRIFLVQGKGSDNAKVIGSITNLHQIYNGLRDAQRDTGRLKSEVKKGIEESEELGDKVLAMAGDFKRLDRKHKIVKEVFEIAQRIEQKAEKITKIRSEMRSVDENVKKRQKKVALFDGIDYAGLRKKVDLTFRVKLANTAIDKINRSIIESERKLDLLQFVSVDKHIITITKLKRLTEAKSRLTALRHDEDRIQIDMEAIDERLVKAEVQMKKFDVCDVCGAEKEHWTI